MLKMRELRGDDLFYVLPILAKVGVSDDLVKLFKDKSDTETIPAKQLPQDHKKKKVIVVEEKISQEQKVKDEGAKIIARLIRSALTNLAAARPDLNSFLALLTETNVETIEQLGIVDYTQLVVTFFKKPELMSFFKLLVSLMSNTEENVGASLNSGINSSLDTATR